MVRAEATEITANGKKLLKQKEREESWKLLFMHKEKRIYFKYSNIL